MKVDGMVNRGKLCTMVYSRVGSQWGWRLVSTMSWKRLGDLQKVTEDDLLEEVQGEDVRNFHKDQFKTVEAQIMSGEGKSEGVMRWRARDS